MEYAVIFILSCGLGALLAALAISLHSRSRALPKKVGAPAVVRGASRIPRARSADAPARIISPARQRAERDFERSINDE